jgi:GxxExxY protein
VDDDDLGTLIVGSALKVHSALGPGLLESVYERCLQFELNKAGVEARCQVAVPIEYEGVKFEEGLRLDMLVGDRVVVELKSVERMLPIHIAQLLTYLKLRGLRVGYLLNFNVVHMRDGGIKRVING